eukprot:3937962-Rhodomonas_salina.2
MVRPKASKLNKQLSVVFANSVTAPILHQTQVVYTVGRNGAHSVHEIFTQFCPKATSCQSRDGVTEAQFNKALENHGFDRVRMRATTRQIMGKVIDRKSCYRFGGRRWLDPDDANDMAEIHKRCQQMHNVPGAQSTCSVTELVQILRETIASENAEMWCKRSHRASNHDHAPSYSVRSQPAEEVFSRHEASEADTDEQPSPSFLDSDECENQENLPSFTNDDSELQVKLEKEEYSAKDLPALLDAVRQQEQPSCESTFVRAFRIDSSHAVQCEPTDMRTKEFKSLVLSDEDFAMSLTSEGLMSFIGVNEPEECCAIW